MPPNDRRWHYYNLLAKAVAVGAITPTEALRKLKLSGRVTKCEEQMLLQCIRQEQALRRQRILPIVIIIVQQNLGRNSEARPTNW